MKLVTLVGEVLTAVTMDRVVCTANVRQKGQVVGLGRLGGLKVRNKGEVLKAVTMDRVVCTANVRQKGQVVGWGRLGGLKVRNKGDVLEMVVEED